ncbi:MAG: UDP-N-acetylmuramoyl-tripeptide--D-alanyl-D-alanine ligase [Eubacteriales bacterium]|nr:UDP-N-acetylmuramoyl-tripeptide--D-alanyl-D-alanine ligase [Eubacteriales bacterium]
MKNLTLKNIAKACNGSYFGPEADFEKEITDITTDSRKVQKGGLFAAIVGERADGHTFIPSVFEKGALCVLCEKAPQNCSGAYILVESTQKALMGIAEFYRQQLKVKVVGVTGSVGKTSTKEMIASVLSEKYRVLKTLGNFNNELGLPLTVFRLREEDEVAVLEMGINHFGEMHRLSKIARPDICVITNIGTCHLEFLGDRDGVLKAKSEIFDFISSDGKIILNGDDDKLAGLQEMKGITPSFFGMESRCEIWADAVESAGLKGVRCTIHDRTKSFRVLIPIPGEHMVQNALAATAVGEAMGMTAEEISRGIEKLQALPGRFRVMEHRGVTVVDDCYNANPVSMKASLEAFAGAAQGRKIAVLGDMGELGPEEKKLHEDVGVFAGKTDISRYICVGRLCRNLAEALRKTNAQADVIAVDTTEEALAGLPQWIREGDAVLVKASHFMHFEKIVDALTRNEE